MKKIISILLLIVVVTVCFVSCKETAGEVTFGSSDILTSSFDGLGVEWGTYEDTNKMIKGSWSRVLSAVDRLNPTLVRCMTNLDWFVTDFDNKGTKDDFSDDTWSYNFNNKQMANASDILDYCQAKGIKVAFGVWNVIGNVDPEKDVYGMIENEDPDPRWAKMNADLMEYLIKVKGYTCIRWFVNTNEPNVLGRKGSSKNAYGSFDRWAGNMRNLRKAFDDIGLKDLSLVGGDATRYIETEKTFMTNAAKNLSDILDNYGVHVYANYSELAKGQFEVYFSDLVDLINAKDSALGKSKNIYIWESGLLWGKNTDTDCNEYITDYAYGLCMADYTVQAILGGANGVVYWDLDDAMHYMYSEEGNTPKEWGMFSTLATADSDMQEYRPWYHSSVLLTNLLRPGYTIYGKYTGYEAVRAMAAVSPDRKRGGYVVVNNSKDTVKEKMILNDKVDGGDKLYIYYYNEKMLKLGTDGFVEPNYVIDGTLNTELNLEIPGNTLVVVSNERI